MSDKYGETGKLYTLGEASIKVDDDFILATVLAVVGVLSHHINGFDQQASETAARIYEEIKRQNQNNS
jgi:hypothetical protein